MNQTKLGSWIEAWVNIVIGFSINLVANLIIFPLFGYSISLSQNLGMGVIYTVISLVRQYAIRRWFNARLHKLSMRIAGVK